MFPKPGPSNHRRNGANRCLLIPRYPFGIGSPSQTGQKAPLHAKEFGGRTFDEDRELYEARSHQRGTRSPRPDEVAFWRQYSA
jgi:hypothetical protein